MPIAHVHQCAGELDQKDDQDLRDTYVMLLARAGCNLLTGGVYTAVANGTAVALPRGRLFLLPRTGHVPQIERPRSVARAVLGMINAVNHYRW